MSRVSIIMPAYNVANFVGEAIRSLGAQDWPELELIAIDDGSSDATGDLLASAVEQFGASGPARTGRVITQVNGGAGAARNVGLDHATGEHILFCDADDRLHPGAITAIAGLLDDPSLCMTFCRARHINAVGDEMGVESPPVRGKLTAQDLICDNPIHSGTGVMLTRAAVRRAGRFDTSLPACIDLDFWVRACADQGACIACPDKVLVNYRRRRGQITANWRNQRDGWRAVAQKAVANGQLTPAQVSQAKARTSIVWATTAYQAGDFAAARGLMARAVVGAPRYCAASPDARIRLLACVASLLPRRWHEGLRKRYQ